VDAAADPPTMNTGGFELLARHNSVLTPGEGAIRMSGDAFACCAPT